jgi:hypothetical protein
MIRNQAAELWPKDIMRLTGKQFKKIDIYYISQY